MTTLDIAKEYVGFGWSILPVKPDEKRDCDRSAGF